MSSSEARPVSYSRTASSRYGTSNRFTMNAVESFVWTGVLPTARTHSVAVATAASSVRIVRATSTSFISGTGLKKWSPRTWRGRVVAAARAVTLHDEVLVARIAWGGQIRSSFAKGSFLSCWFSVMASTTRAHPLRSSSRGVPPMRASAASFVAASSLPFAASPSKTSRSRLRPRLTSSALASTKSTGNPAWAATWAMPEPMRPQPMTPTFLMVMSVSRGRRRLVARATTRQGRRLVVGRPRRARIPHGDRHGAGAGAATDAAIGLRCALGGARWRTVLSERLIERRHARLDGLREDAQDHRRADRRLRLLGGGAGRPRAERQEGAGQERGATAHESDPCRDSHL